MFVNTLFKDIIINFLLSDVFVKLRATRTQYKTERSLTNFRNQTIVFSHSLRLNSCKGEKMDDQVKRQIDVINQHIKELNSLYHTAAVRSGVSDGEICVWSMLLTTDKEYSQQDLCELLFLPRQTINSIISVLKKKEYISLEHVPGTRNRKVIRLSDKGRNYGEKNIMWIFEAEQHAMEDADPHEISALISMLEKYINKLKKEFTEN